MKAFRLGSHLEILQVLRLLHQWSTKTPLGKAQDEVKVASATAVDWYNFIRDICIQYFIDHPAVIGGPGKVVEMSATSFYHPFLGHRHPRSSGLLFLFTRFMALPQLQVLLEGRSFII
ncbi:hypothetical protein EMCRGX_G032969 [Ephydatia muelleri]